MLFSFQPEVQTRWNVPSGLRVVSIDDVPYQPERDGDDGPTGPGASTSSRSQPTCTG